MNKNRREILKKAKDLLDKTNEIISMVIEEEQDSLDNIPENLQSSDKYERMETVIDILEETIDRIDNAKENIDSALE